MRTYADLTKKAVLKRNADMIVIKNCRKKTSINSMTGKPFSMIIYRNEWGSWVAEEIYLYEDFEDNYYYLFESIEIVNGQRYAVFPSTIRDFLNDCEDYAMGKKEDFRVF